MKSLISGQHGFIGSHLSTRLSGLGHTVLPIPREILYEPIALTEFFKKEKPDYIFNLASYGNHSNQKDIPMTIFANIIGTFNILSAAQDITYKKLVHFSSSSVYLPVETYYSAAKASSERIANAFRQQTKKPIIIVRPFSVYGEGEADFRFIPTVCRSLIFNEGLTLDPNPVHDWIYVKDFVDILVENLDSEEDLDIGTGMGTTNQQIVEKLVRISGKTCPVKTAIHLRTYDNEKWIAKHAYRTKHSLDVGLLNTYEYYKKQFKN